MIRKEDNKLKESIVTKYKITCSYKKNTAVENVFEAHPTTVRVESGSRYINTHSAIINVGRLMTTSDGAVNFSPMLMLSTLI